MSTLLSRASRVHSRGGTRSAALGRNRWALLPVLCGLAALAGPGCNTTAPSDATEPAPSNNNAKASAEGLPDLTKEFEPGQCEEIRGASVPGADSYFHGRFLIDGEAASGHETWWLNANQTWTEKGGTSCTIRWQVRGTKVAPVACRDCDYGLKLTASPEVGNSKCPEELVKREARSQDLHYDVKLSSNGEAFIYFSKSGNLLGQGFHKDNEVVYRTQHQCKWF